MSRYHVKGRCHKHHSHKCRIVICKHCTKVVKKFRIVKCCKVVKPVKVIKCTKTIVVGGQCPCGNRVGNPSFESETLAPWVATGEVTIEGGQAAHTGEQGVQLDADEAITQIVSVTAGCCYELMFWAKGPSGEGNTLTATVTFAGSTEPDLTIFIAGGSLDSSSWVSYRDFTPCVPEGATTATINLVAG
ncbi:MAG: hypothetical protein ACM3ZQ_11460, partial [Bacillota bacterium]